MDLLFIIGNSCRLPGLSVYKQAWGPPVFSNGELHHAFVGVTQPGVVCSWMGQTERGRA